MNNEFLYSTANYLYHASSNQEPTAYKVLQCKKATTKQGENLSLRCGRGNTKVNPCTVDQRFCNDCL